jgi:acetylornithine deacetylase/succinyl-diaminopimelate desuccinylase-like protein
VEQLGAQIVGIGLTHHGAMLHAPNENIHIEHFEKMMAFSAALFDSLRQTAEGRGRTSPPRLDKARNG